MRGQTTFRITDVEDGKLKHQLTVESFDNGIGLFIPGYGDSGSADNHGIPVILEMRNGIPHLLVWDDINNEEPTVISLEAAAISNRKD